MITSPAFRGKRYAVLGLARSGLAAVEALLASGAEVTAWDSREEARENLLKSHPGEGRDPLPPASEFMGPGLRRGDSLALSPALTIADPLEIDLAGYDGVVVSPGVPLNRHPIAAKARAAGVPVIGDIELFAQARAGLPPHKVVGITGTNGKSTVTALVHHILKSAGVPAVMGGNIGLPILAQDPLPEGGVYVLELSSYQLDLTFTLDCDVAVLLNVTPDHLDRYDSFEAYSASKARLFEMQTSGHPAFFDRDDPVSRAVGDRIRELGTRRRDVFFQTHEDLWTFEENVNLSAEVRARGKAWPALKGPHNASNATAAINVARSLGVENTDIDRGLRTFRGLPHRMELVRAKDGILFVNDSKATNPDSTAPALAAFPHVHWIVGGLAKSEDLGPCEDQLGHVRAAYTIGQAGPMFAQLLEGRVPVSKCELLVTAVNEAADAAAAGEVVLLSPACASFDQFRDYEARGDAFRAAVGALK